MNTTDATQGMRKKYGSIVGIGLLYVWGCAILYWVESSSQIIAGIGGSLVSFSMIAIFLYTNSLENELNKISRRVVNGFYENPSE